jgi:hypothetical protein
MAKPTPLMICVANNKRRVLRCTAAIFTSVPSAPGDVSSGAMVLTESRTCAMSLRASLNFGRSGCVIAMIRADVLVCAIDAFPKCRIHSQENVEAIA